ncbi:MAG: hypothetical protein EHM24_00675 [Acidobacteria bacterium]|nr:MAG: hypothetical protein EHM24_00675 [Acidobacteriota bacterium]
MDGDARLEQLDATLEHLERLCGRLEHAERHFKQITEDCQGVMQGLVALDRRHASTVAGLNERLGDWCNLEGKLLEESARRIEQFERGVSHEWMVLRQLNEEPIAEMREQADTLRRTCLEAAREARLRLEAAEQAYASQAAALERRMVEWQRRWIDAATSSPSLAASNGAVEPWPLEGVAQLHQELRTAPGGPGTVPETRALVPARFAPAAAGQAPSAAEEPPASTEQTPPAAAEEAAGRRGRWPRPAALAATAIAVTLVGVVTVTLWYRGSSAPLPAESITPPAAVPVADASRERDERLAEAQKLVERAGSMVEILAAPDLLRYGLSGTGPAASSYAQVLWSRSRGVAVTASRLPVPPPGQAYTMWVISDGQAAAVGVLVPDASGRASLVVPGPLTLPRLVALRITLEEGAGSGRPTGPTCLAGGPTS